MTPPTEVRATDGASLPWYALERAPQDFATCPHCGGFAFVQDDLWGSTAGEYLLECLYGPCGLRFVGLVI